MRIDQHPGRAQRSRGGRARNAGERESDSAAQAQARGRTPARVACARWAALLLLGFAAAGARAASFALPPDGGNMVGHMRVVRLANARNTLLDIARHYDLGYNEITAANPGVSLWLPQPGSRIVVPTEFILPPKPWVGVVVDVPRRRLYYFPAAKPGQPARVVTFPVGIARSGWPTPLGRTRIIAKYRDPSWLVPKDILQEHRSEGQARYPTYFPPGPDNPMGMLAMQTGFPEIFIHGTDRPWGVGMRVSHGCIHLYPEDAAYLFARVHVGTPVRVIDRPLLVGERAGALYLSASKPISDYPAAESYLTRAVGAVLRYQRGHAAVDPPVQWHRLLKVAEARGTLAMPISPGAPTLRSRLAALAAAPYDFSPYGIDANDAAAPRASGPRTGASSDR